MRRPTDNFLRNVWENQLHLLAHRQLEPLAVMFSGGRTSARMLRLLLDMYGGSFPDTVRVMFQNTGREHPATYTFVQRVSQEWGVPVTWLEFDSAAPHRLRVVDHNSASRDGRPFWDLFTSVVPRRRDGTAGLRPLPGPAMRICTAQLKIELVARYLRKVLGWEGYYYEAIGLRADEPRRVERQVRGVGRIYKTVPLHPLYAAGLSAQDVADFWSRQPFDLGLPIYDPRWGNCDLCFLKSAEKIKRNIAEDPSSADFWIALEEYPRDRLSLFRRDRPSYRALRELALAGDFSHDGDPFLDSCSCTD